MRIAMIGTRGVPASYGGFETAVEEIGARLYLSPLTAKTRVSRIMTKLAARDRVQLVIVAYESGLVTPGVVLGE